LNAFASTSCNSGCSIGTAVLRDPGYYLPGAVPTDYDERNRYLNYQRATDVPKHRLKWNFLIDLPVGKGKKVLGNANNVLDKFVGGWQLAGSGSLRSTWFALPTGNWNFTGEPVHNYGYKYPIQNCTSGVCVPGYLWWNGYIPANKINSHDAAGNPNGYEGIPADYKPAVTPLIPWGSARRHKCFDILGHQHCLDSAEGRYHRAHVGFHRCFEPIHESVEAGCSPVGPGRLAV
jgi:hypothetical protein